MLSTLRITSSCRPPSPSSSTYFPHLSHLYFISCFQSHFSIFSHSIHHGFFFCFPPSYSSGPPSASIHPSLCLPWGLATPSNSLCTFELSLSLSRSLSQFISTSLTRAEKSVFCPYLSISHHWNH